MTNVGSADLGIFISFEPFSDSVLFCKMEAFCFLLGLPWDIFHVCGPRKFFIGLTCYLHYRNGVIVFPKTSLCSLKTRCPLCFSLSVLDWWFKSLNDWELLILYTWVTQTPWLKINSFSFFSLTSCWGHTLFSLNVFKATSVVKTVFWVILHMMLNTVFGNTKII